MCRAKREARAYRASWIYLLYICIAPPPASAWSRDPPRPAGRVTRGQWTVHSPQRSTVLWHKRVFYEKDSPLNPPLGF